MKIKFNLSQIDQIVGGYILPLFKTHSIFAFAGPLGVGKTTLIREILKQKGIKSTITSPTFNYVNSYRGENDIIFNHFDLYRINSIDEFIKMGFDEYLAEENSVNLIEWPEVIQDLLDDPQLKMNACLIKLSYLPGNELNRLMEVVKV